MFSSRLKFERTLELCRVQINCYLNLGQDLTETMMRHFQAPGKVRWTSCVESLSHSYMTINARMQNSYIKQMYAKLISTFLFYYLVRQSQSVSYTDPDEQNIQT